MIIIPVAIFIVIINIVGISWLIVLLFHTDIFFKTQNHVRGITINYTIKSLACDYHTNFQSVTQPVVVRV